MTEEIKIQKRIVDCLIAIWILLAFFILSVAMYAAKSNERNKEIIRNLEKLIEIKNENI